MLLLDTNVLLYAAQRRCEEHAPCRALVERCRRAPTPWYLTWGILYEFLRVVTHPRALRSPWSTEKAWKFVAALLASPSLGVLGHTPLHREVAERTLAEVPGLRGSILHDVHTAVLMREHGIRTIYTRDAHFRRFPFLEVIDPLTGS